MSYDIVFSRKNTLAKDVASQNDDDNYDPHILLHTPFDNCESFEFIERQALLS